MAYDWAGAVARGGTSCYGGTCGSSLPDSGGGSSIPWTWNAGGVDPTLSNIYKQRAQALKRQQLEERASILQNMMLQYQGPESSFIRWLIGNEMNYVRNELMRCGTPERPYFGSNWLEQYMSPKGFSDVGVEYRPPPIPDWMREYIQPVEVTPKQPEGKGSRRKKMATRPYTTYELRPLSPTANLSPEQQDFMAGWLAWNRAGFPTRFNESALMKMSDIERYWSPYRMESQAMFPETPRKPIWATATQAR